MAPERRPDMKTITGKHIGIAMLRCPKCGSIYTRRKVCYNRKQADSWSAWMQRNYNGERKNVYSVL